MFKLLHAGFICLLLSQQAAAQLSAPPKYNYHHPSEDKPSWQRLNLWLSSIFFRTSKQSGVDWDTSLIYVSRSLGLSRLSVAGEGMDDPALLTSSSWFDKGKPEEGVQLLSKATGIKHLRLLLLLGSYYAFQPDNYRRHRDSTEYFLKKALTESKTLGEKSYGRLALCLLGKMYAHGSDTVNSKIIFSQLISECKSAGDKSGEARALAYRALYTNASPTNTQERLGYIQEAIKIYQSLKETENEIIAWTYSGYLYIRLGKLDDGYAAFLKALDLVQAIGYPYSQYSTDALAMISSAQDKFGEPLKYNLETIKTAEAVRDSIGWARFYPAGGRVFYRRRKR